MITYVFCLFSFLKVVFWKNNIYVIKISNIYSPGMQDLRCTLNWILYSELFPSIDPHKLFRFLAQAFVLKYLSTYREILCIPGLDWAVISYFMQLVFKSKTVLKTPDPKLGIFFNQQVSKEYHFCKFNAC